MNLLKTKILRLFKSKKLNVFILFFLISLSILILTKLSKTYQGTLIFNIKPVNVKETQVILNDSANHLKITLETYGFKWLRYAISKPKIEIDLNTDVQQKDSTLIWTEKKGFSSISNQFGKDIKVLNVNPDSLIFRYDVNQVKMVPIKPDFNISFLKGYSTLNSIKTSPDSVKLIGPASLLQKINFINTEHKEFNEIKSNINKSIVLKTDGINKDIKISTNVVKFNLKVSKFTEGAITLPINLVNVPDSIKVNYFPKQVTLKYATTLDNFNSILEEDFKVECDYSLSKNKSYLVPQIVKQPKNIKNVRVEEQQIEFIITQK